MSERVAPQRRLSANALTLGRIASVPWRPSREGEEQQDGRLDPYRERAAKLTTRGGRDATLFVRVETWWTSTGGRLWWRRWSAPYEIPHGYVLFADGEFDDWVVGHAELARDLADWSRDRLRYAGEVLDVEWLDAAASRHVRDQVFGLEPL